MPTTPTRPETPPGTLRVVAAIVDTATLTLYRPDGTTLVIPQGDPRVRRLVDEAVAQITRQGYADLVLETPPQPVFDQFQERSGGLVKLFRVAKAKLKGWLGGTKEAGDGDPAVVGPVAVGAIPATEPPAPDADRLGQAVAEIMRHATPVADPGFTERGLDAQAPITEADGTTPSAPPRGVSPDTIIAVVETPAGPAVVPGMEKIRNQFERACTLGDATAVTKFLQRLGAVIHQRAHSVEDLLKFLERADLPLAADGSILIYKVLRTTDEPGIYVDCHTRKVRQWIGAYVCMDPGLVDPNRYNECSTGLHVARRGYIGGFGGDVCVLAKLAPEDVIAVPHGDANKMRVCGYHIIAELTPEQHAALKANKPITGTADGQALLARALAGTFARTHEVRITRQQGEGVVTTPLVQGAPAKPGTKEAKTRDLPGSKAVPEIGRALPERGSKEPEAPPVDPREVAQRVEAVKATSTPTASPPVSPSPRKDRIATLLQTVAVTMRAEDRAAALTELWAIKRTCRKPWTELGVPVSVMTLLEAHRPGTSTPPKGQAKTAKPAVQAAARPARTGKAPPKKGGTPNAGQTHRQKISILLGTLHATQDKLEQAALAREIVAVRKGAKKGWAALGVTPEQQHLIEGLAT